MIRSSGRTKLCVALLMLLVPAMRAQEFERVVEGIPVERNGQIMAHPFFGGLDVFLPQFVDIDGDGDADLFLAEANEQNWRLLYLENRGTPQRADFHWQAAAYDTLRIGNWFYFVDIDADGDADLYCGNNLGGLRFYRNIGSPHQPAFALAAEEVLDANAEPMASEPTSIPAFADIDADGDFDFFTGVTTGTIRLYRNTGTPFTPRFTFETETWQNLIIISVGRTHAAPAPALAPDASRHGASGICFSDIDQDLDQDFFYGDLFHKSVYFLRNEGSPQNAHVAITDTLFPPPQTVSTNGFNIPRFADLDADGAVDFFVACIQQGQDNFLFYPNVGEPTQPQFSLATNNFLTMLDIGSANLPAFADLDADGDPDLLMGNDEGFFSYYRNNGTPTAPAWQWVSDNFQNLHPSSFFLAAPAFVDIDADGDFDLFSGYHFGRIAYFENRGTPQSPNFVLVTDAYENIDVGDQSTPHFADIDHDGDFDLFIGEARRNLIYLYENIGTARQAHFILKKQIRPPLILDESVPYTYDWNGDGYLDLFSGNQIGTLAYFRGTAQPDSFVFVEERFAGIDVGFASAPVLMDLDQDGRVDLVVGERAGGLNLFRGKGGSMVQQRDELPQSFDLSVYPNPMRESANFVVHAASAGLLDGQPALVIFNVLGERVAEVSLRQRDDSTWFADWRPAQSDVAAGVYFARVTLAHTQMTRKLLLVN